MFTELGAQTSDVNIDGACAAVVLVPPHTTEQRFAREHFARIRGKELQEFVFHVGEIERCATDSGLIGLEIEDEFAILNEFGSDTCAGVPIQMLETSFEFTRVERRQTEIVVQVVAEFEVA